jgi:hypothetical protein
MKTRSHMHSPPQKPKKVAPCGFPTLSFCKKVPTLSPISNPSRPQSPLHPTPSPSRFSSGGGGRVRWATRCRRIRPDKDLRCREAARSSHAPQDAATGASPLFAWQGGPLTGPLGALLAAARAPPGMGAGAWPGFPSTSLWAYYPLPVTRTRTTRNRTQTTRTRTTRC